MVTLNDANPKAAELIRENAALNSLEVTVRNTDANIVMSENKFDFIDIDPFGPPVRFLDSALRGVKHGGTLAVTATDTSALCGTYPRACKRKYDSTPLRTDYYNELGLRILIGCVARAALKYDIAVTPLFSHCTQHYFRTYLHVKRSRKEANEALRKIRYVGHCFACLGRAYHTLDDLPNACDCGTSLRHAGPVWSGPFAEEEFCRKLAAQITEDGYGTVKEGEKLVSQVAEEQKITVPYYDIHKIFKVMKAPVPSMEEIMSRLQAEEFSVSRTHFSGCGLRTDAKVSDMYRIFKK
jgi:tRNA (guanine26-N2/guanine27-N2)-dimethyltransferase